METAIMGVALAFNFLIVGWKFEKERYLDALIDVSLLAIIMWLTSGTLKGMLVGTIASAIISAVLIIRRPQFSEL